MYTIVFLKQYYKKLNIRQVFQNWVNKSKKITFEILS